MPPEVQRTGRVKKIPIVPIVLHNLGQLWLPFSELCAEEKIVKDAMPKVTDGLAFTVQLTRLCYDSDGVKPLRSWNNTFLLASKLANVGFKHY